MKEKEKNTWRRDIFGLWKRRKENEKEENIWRREIFGLWRRRRIENEKKRKIFGEGKFVGDRWAVGLGEIGPEDQNF